MISVLMSTYNRAPLLPRAIDSVLNQTYKDIEFIIIDDGSTDGTEELIRSYDDKRISYKKLKKNSFYCYAANYGLQFCKGEYLAFMNSDDVWLPDKLEKQLQFMEENKEYAVCFTAASLIDYEGNDITDECPEMRDTFGKQYASQKECIQYLLKYRNTLCHPSGLARKEIIDRVGGYNLLFCQLADYDLWMRILPEGPIYVMPERLIKFQWDMKKKEQISIATKENSIRAFNEQVLIKKHLMERLSDEKLIEFFGDQFRNKNSKTHLELEFERAFLLMDCLNEARGLKVLGLEKLEKVMHDPKAMEVLREHFGLDIFELYAWNRANMYQTPWAESEEAEAKIKEIQLTVNHYRNLMAQLEHDKIILEASYKEQQLTTNHYRNLKAQVEIDMEALKNAYRELQRVNDEQQGVITEQQRAITEQQRVITEQQRMHAEVEQNLKKEHELTVNHYQNLMAQLNREKETLQNNINELQGKNAELQNVIVEKEQLIYIYDNSTSWKMTAPFRNFMRMLRKIIK